MWPFKKKLSLKQQIINIGFEQLKLNNYLQHELNEVHISIIYNSVKNCVEIKVENLFNTEWHKEILFIPLTKNTFQHFHNAMIRTIDGFINLRSD